MERIYLFDVVRAMEHHNIPFVKDESVDGEGVVHEFAAEGQIAVCYTECMTKKTADYIWSQTLERALVSYKESNKINKILCGADKEKHLMAFPRLEVHYTEHTAQVGDTVLTIMVHDDYMEKAKEILAELHLLLPMVIIEDKE